MSSARRRRAVLLGLMIAPTASVFQVRAGASITVSGFLLRNSTNLFCETTLARVFAAAVLQ